MVHVINLTPRSGNPKDGTTIRNCIQTDAKIPETAAGGALMDSSGRGCLYKFNAVDP